MGCKACKVMWTREMEAGNSWNGQQPGTLKWLAFKSSLGLCGTSVSPYFLRTLSNFCLYTFIEVPYTEKILACYQAGKVH